MLFDFPGAHCLSHRTNATEPEGPGLVEPASSRRRAHRKGLSGTDAAPGPYSATLDAVAGRYS